MRDDVLFFEALFGSTKRPREAECAICYEDMEGDDYLEVCAGGHCFHPACLRRYVESQWERRKELGCPTCRRGPLIPMCAECKGNDVPDPAHALCVENFCAMTGPPA
jgi:hypothetical protein